MSALGLTRRGGLDAERQFEPRSAALHYSGNTTLREGDQELLKQVENKRDFIIFFLEICEFVCYKIEEKNGYNLRSPNLPPPQKRGEERKRNKERRIGRGGEGRGYQHHPPPPPYLFLFFILSSLCPLFTISVISAGRHQRQCRIIKKNDKDLRKKKLGRS